MKSHYLQHPRWLALGFLNHQQYVSRVSPRFPFEDFIFLRKDGGEKPSEPLEKEKKASQVGSRWWWFPKIVVFQNGWFIIENLIEMDDLGGPPLFLETPRWWWFHLFLNFHPYLGKIPILTSIFFRWVGSTTNHIFFVQKGERCLTDRWFDSIPV